jgi:hypothetical protein
MTEIIKQFMNEEKKVEYVVTAEIGESGDVNKIIIEKVYYPLYPHGNYVKNVIEIDASEAPLRIEIYDIRMSWNGTGRDNIIEFSYNDHSPETPWWLNVREIEEIENADDVEEYVEWIMKYITETISESFKMFKNLGGDE